VTRRRAALLCRLAGYGRPDEARSHPSSTTADIEFAQGMIAHHEQAIEMAEIALDPNSGASSEVIDLAIRIKGAGPDMSDGHDMSTMDGMMSADQMNAMAAMTGAEFDQVRLGMMIAHHEGAIKQSQAAKNNGSNADVRALADEVISAQQAEITEMEALLTS